MNRTLLSLHLTALIATVACANDRESLPDKLVFSTVTAQEAPLVLRGEIETELAPHGLGNVYAPHVLLDQGKWRMWYGGQGRDGHDRIHLAESDDGKQWKRRGVVLDNGTANHVNDPCVLKQGETYYLWYTQADQGVQDEIHVATSPDGIAWRPRGVAVGRGTPGSWDTKIVGRPAVLRDGEQFRMWYDGRAEGDRSVGHALSADGIHWAKTPAEPVYGEGAGGIDVQRVGHTYVMLFESREGTKLATSNDGLRWSSKGLWHPLSDKSFDRHGQVTPFLLVINGAPSYLFFGAAGRDSWDGNTIHQTGLKVR